jgi:ABC-2 type transport system ATP-binding protein
MSVSPSFINPAPQVVQAAAANQAAVALELRNVSKTYGKLQAVSDLSFEVHAGEVFGLLGPNGAGKTSTISVVATVLRPSGGDVLIFGHSLQHQVREVRRIIGVVPQEISLYPGLSALENLKFFGRMYKVESTELLRRTEELLELVGLEGRRNDRVETFSGGMKRRLNLAVSLVHKPRLVLLDEPTVGVDPHSREKIFEIVRQLRNAGTAILYTTHYMEEAEKLCDRIGIMDEGKIIAMGPLLQLLTEAGCSEVIELRGLPPGVDLSGLQSAPGVCRMERHDEMVRLFVNRAVRVLGPLQQALGRYVDTVAVEIAPLSLENLFMQLTGKELRD